LGKDFNSLRAAVVGSGSWGISFSKVLVDSGTITSLYSRNIDTLNYIKTNLEHPNFPGVHISSRLNVTGLLSEAVKDKHIIFLAVPTQSLRRLLETIKPLYTDQIIVSLSKGLELGTMLSSSNLIKEVLHINDDKIAVLSGPNLSGEVIHRQVGGAVVASTSEDTRNKVALSCSATYFKSYVSEDIVGVEICGDLKNVAAIAAGIARGYDFGTNTLASIITRSLAEMTRIVIALGGKQETLLGLAGVGDLVATCSSSVSRNNELGYKIAKGVSIYEALKQSKGVAEGYYTAKSAYLISQEHNLNTPIFDAIYKILYEDAEADKVLSEILLDDSIESEL
jgi:glycerol-3-phosphate dehydrogenase (NAD(P)+)